MTTSPKTTTARATSKTAAAKAKAAEDAKEKARIAAEEAAAATAEAEKEEESKGDVEGTGEGQTTPPTDTEQDQSGDETADDEVETQSQAETAPAPEEAKPEVQPAPTTLADAQLAATANSEMNAPAQSIAELTKGNEAFARKEVALGGGVSISARANHPAVNEGARTETLERYLVSKYNLREEDYSEALRRTIRGFEQYHMNMNSRAPVTLEEAARHQQNWFRIVSGALDSQVGDSTVCFDVILFLAARHADDLFTDRLACRAFNLLGDSVRDAFLNLQTVIINAANPRTRSHYIRTKLNVDALSKSIKSENQRRNLLAYLNSAAE